MQDQTLDVIKAIGIREKYREAYWLGRDPILNDRLYWRAQAFRHLVHFLPGQSILELGAGSGLFTKHLQRVSRGENPITSVTFSPEFTAPKDLPPAVVWRDASAALDKAAGKKYDFIISMELLDKDNSCWFMKNAFELLKPGGQIVFYESNPWNPVLSVNRAIGRLFKRKDPRALLNRIDLYELISESGFVQIFIIFTDFMYAPLTPFLTRILKNFSVVLENMPVVRNFAGSILIYAQKPPKEESRPRVSLCKHNVLNNAVSVVVPCHNEEMNIEPLVNDLMAFYGGYIKEIVLVDDNSKDNTREVLQRLAAANSAIKPMYRLPPNGAGRAIADGYKAATGKYVLSMDCDFRPILSEVRDMFDEAAKGYDVVIGSRFSRHSVLLRYPWMKIAANRSFHCLARMLFRGQFRDLTNNLKLMKIEVVKRLELTQPGFAVNAETGLQPLLMGCSIKEIPVSWINRDYSMGVSSFHLTKAGGGYARVLFKLWVKSFTGIQQHHNQDQSSG